MQSQPSVIEKTEQQTVQFSYGWEAAVSCGNWTIFPNWPAEFGNIFCTKLCTLIISCSQMLITVGFTSCPSGYPTPLCRSFPVIFFVLHFSCFIIYFSFLIVCLQHCC